MKDSLLSKLVSMVAALARLHPKRQVVHACMDVGFGVVRVAYSLQLSPSRKCSDFNVDE